MTSSSVPHWRDNDRRRRRLQCDAARRHNLEHDRQFERHKPGQPDASSIIFSAPLGDPTQLASYKTLTAFNYTGVGGGIVLNTYLGGDGSPSDRLIIDGGAGTGATKLDIRNTTGPGAETVANGIPVVEAITAGRRRPARSRSPTANCGPGRSPTICSGADLTPVTSQ